MLDALIPLGFMIIMLTSSVILFGWTPPPARSRSPS
jgi:hypothetical protein